MSHYVDGHGGDSRSKRHQKDFQGVLSLMNSSLHVEKVALYHPLNNETVRNTTGKNKTAFFRRNAPCMEEVNGLGEFDDEEEDRDWEVLEVPPGSSYVHVGLMSNGSPLIARAAITLA